MDAIGKQGKYLMHKSYRNESKIVESVSKSMERAHLYSVLAAGFIAMTGSAWFMWSRTQPSAVTAAILFLGVVLAYLGVNVTFAFLLRYAIKDFVERARDKAQPGKEKSPPPPPGQEWDYIKVLDQNGRYKWVARDGGGGKH
jgi:hypothetical protein